MRRRGDEAVLRFEYDRGLVAAVKALPRRRFDPETKEWVLPLHHYLDAARALEAMGAQVELDPELEALTEEGAVPPPPRPRAAVTRAGGHYMVRFEYRPALVRAVRQIPGRTFDPSSKAWFVPIEEAELTLRAIVEALEEVGCVVDLPEDLLPLASP